jgi:hypothetical protein
LPQTLKELEDPISGFIPQQDPQTKQSYEYIVKGENEFELCAVFNLVNNASNIEEINARLGYNASNWNHEAGKVCFQRTIDKDLYPLMPRKIQ